MIITARRIIFLCCMSLLLAGCASSGIGSIVGGECKIFQPPKYVVLGKTSYDQDYVDGNIEAGIGGCGWRRPQPRPSRFEAAMQGGPPRVASKPKRKSFIKRIRERVSAPRASAVAPDRDVDPVASVPPDAAAVRVDPVPLPVPRPRSPVDILLNR